MFFWDLDQVLSMFNSYTVHQSVIFSYASTKLIHLSTWRRSGSRTKTNLRHLKTKKIACWPLLKARGLFTATVWFPMASCVCPVRFLHSPFIPYVRCSLTISDQWYSMTPCEFILLTLSFVFPTSFCKTLWVPMMSRFPNISSVFLRLRGMIRNV